MPTASLGLAAATAPERRESGTAGRQPLQRRPHVTDDRIPDRRPRRLVRVVRDVNQPRAGRQDRSGDVRVVAKDRRPDDEHQIVPRSRSASGLIASGSEPWNSG